MVAWSGIERMENHLVSREGDIDIVSPDPRWKISETIKESLAK